MISGYLKHCIQILFGVKAHEVVDLMLQNSSFASRCLYPGLEGRFILESIKPSVMDSLKKAAKTRGNTFCFVDICVLSLMCYHVLPRGALPLVLLMDILRADNGKQSVRVLSHC